VKTYLHRKRGDLLTSNSVDACQCCNYRKLFWHHKAHKQNRSTHLLAANVHWDDGFQWRVWHLSSRRNSLLRLSNTALVQEIITLLAVIWVSIYT